MHFTVILFDVVVGSVIGGVTNEIAILYVLRKIIPERKSDLATAIQCVFTDELMTDRHIAEWLDRPDVRQTLEDNASQWMQSLLEANLPSPVELSKERFGQTGIFRFELWRTKLEDFVFSLFLDQIFSDSFENNLVLPYVQKLWNDGKNETIAEMLPGIHEPLLKELRVLATSPVFIERIVTYATISVFDYLSERQKAGELLPEVLQSQLRSAVGDQKEFVAKQIVVMLQRQETQNAIAEIIVQTIKRETMSDPILGLAGSVIDNFVDVKGKIAAMCRNLPMMAEKVVNEEQYQDQIRQFLVGAFDSLMDKRWKSLLKEQDDDAIKKLIRQNILSVLSNTNSTSGQGGSLLLSGVDFLSEELRKITAMPLSEIPGVKGNDPMITQELSKAITNAIRSDYCTELLRDKLRDVSERFSQMPIGRLNQWVSGDLKQAAARDISKQIILLVHEKLGDFTEKTGIWNIISHSVNNFENRKIEQMVRSVCNNELRWVTTLGFILGGLIGLFQGVFNCFLLR